MEKYTIVYFLPDRKSIPYVAPEGVDASHLNIMAVDMAGLVRFGESVVGWHKEETAFNARLCRYYRAFRRWLKEHPANEKLTASFKFAHLAVPRQFLIWRDALKMAQWDFEWADANSRLGAVAGVEHLEKVEGLPDRMIALCKYLEGSDDDKFTNFEIRLQVDRELYQPLVQRLLDAMEARGAKVSRVQFPATQSENLAAVSRVLQSGVDKPINLDAKDGSFVVKVFENSCDLAEYMSIVQPEMDANLWIDAHTKELDNRMIALERPTVGSAVTSRSRILNMLPLALALYDKHPHISKLVEWLSTPKHPLPGRLRYQLADKIGSTGGYKNQECRDIVQKYLDGEFEYHDEEKEASETQARRAAREEKERQIRKENVRLYLPYLDPSNLTDENAERTLRALSVWAKTQVAMMDDSLDAEALAPQLIALSQGIEILLQLFEGTDDDAFDLAIAREWVNDIPMEISLPQHIAQVGCVFTVESPSDVAAEAKRVVWSNMEYTSPAPFDCEFLLPGERDKLIGHAKIWNRDNESRYRYELSVLPFRFVTDRLTIAYAKKGCGEKLVAPPTITRLKSQIANFEQFEVTPTLEGVMTECVERVDNAANKSEYTFDNADRIKLPNMMSATSLDTFTKYPFDYLFERILRFKPAGLANLPELQLAKGKVAHATIQRLFATLGNEAVTNIEEVKRRIASEFDRCFLESIEECGAILMLPEHNLECDSLRVRLQENIKILLDIIATNRLEVIGCEIDYTAHTGFNDDTEDPDLWGRVDMTLRTPQGDPVVFDFKWTTKPKYYKETVETNQSVQLAVYTEMLKEDGGKVITAYFVMPMGRLFTTHPFRGKDVEVITPQNTSDVMAQVVNSYRFRRDQLLSGIVEEGENMALELLSYETNRDSLNLLPLPGDWKEPTDKGVFRYSKYRLFKGSKE